MGGCAACGRQTGCDESCPVRRLRDALDASADDAPPAAFPAIGPACPRGGEIVDYCIGLCSCARDEAAFREGWLAGYADEGDEEQDLAIETAVLDWRPTPRARLDEDGTAVPKTRLVARVPAPDPNGPTRSLVIPPANEYVGDEGTRVGLTPSAADDGWMLAAERDSIANRHSEPTGATMAAARAYAAQRVPPEPDWKDHYDRVAAALGITYDCEGQGSWPGPIEAVLAQIEELKAAQYALTDLTSQAPPDDEPPPPQTGPPCEKCGRPSPQFGPTADGMRWVCCNTLGPVVEDLVGEVWVRGRRIVDSHDPEYVRVEIPHAGGVLIPSIKRTELR